MRSSSLKREFESGDGTVVDASVEAVLRISDVSRVVSPLVVSETEELLSSRRAVFSLIVVDFDMER